MKTKTIHSSIPFDAYKEPWETAKQGYWIIRKAEGCTSMKRIDNPAYEEVEAALAESYDIMVNKIMEMRESGLPFSASDLVLDTIKGLRQIIMKKSLTT